MKLTENTKVKIRVPKHLYEAIQAELGKKHMEEGEYGHDEPMEEDEINEDTSMEMALKQLGTAISSGDAFGGLVALTLLIFGTVVGAAEAPKVIEKIKAFYKVFGPKTKGALARLSGRVKNPEIKNALQNPEKLLDEPAAEPVSEVEELEETIDMETLLEAVNDAAKRKKEKAAKEKAAKEKEAKEKAAKEKAAKEKAAKEKAAKKK